MEAMLSEDGLQAEERMRDIISSAGSVLRELAWADETEEEEEEEIVEAEEQIQIVTEQIASRDGRCKVRAFYIDPVSLATRPRTQPSLLKGN
jgi:hypothetical protein